MTKKTAIIINGDTSWYHLKNVEQSAREFRKMGYKVIVVSPNRPSEQVDQYYDSSNGGLQSLLSGLKEKVDDLVIYTTGHGSKSGDGSCLRLEKTGCQNIAGQLDTIPYGQRTIIMDQCYGGGFARHFIDDPRTLFISSGNNTEQTTCVDFTKYFWSKDVPDKNQDNVISWQERFDYALTNKDLTSTPVLVQTTDYIQPGNAPFPKDVIQVNDEADLKKTLSRLGEGQLAVILFSADWCKACHAYQPKYEEKARLDGGQHLWIVTESKKLAQSFRVKQVPTVMILNRYGVGLTVKDLERPEIELSKPSLRSEEDFKILIKVNKGTENIESRVKLLNITASLIAWNGLNDLALETFLDTLKMIRTSSVDDKEDDETRLNLMIDTAVELSSAGFRKDAENAFKEAWSKVPEAMKSEDDEINISCKLIYEMLTAIGEKWTSPFISELVGKIQNIKDSYIKSWAFASLGYDLAYAGQQNGLKLLEEGVRVARELTDTYKKARGLSGFISRYYFHLGMNDSKIWKQGRKFFEEAEELTKSIKDPVDRADIFTRLADSILSTQSNYFVADFKLSKAFENIDKIKDPNKKIKALFSTIRVVDRLDADRKDSIIEDIEEIIDDDVKDTVDKIRFLGKLSSLKGTINSFRKHFSKAYNLIYKIKSSPKRAVAMAILANEIKDFRRYEANTLFESALESVLSLEDPHMRAETLGNLAEHAFWSQKFTASLLAKADFAISTIADPMDRAIAYADNEKRRLDMFPSNFSQKSFKKAIDSARELSNIHNQNEVLRYIIRLRNEYKLKTLK